MASDLGRCYNQVTWRNGAGRCVSSKGDGNMVTCNSNGCDKKQDEYPEKETLGLPHENLELFQVRLLTRR